MLNATRRAPSYVPGPTTWRDTEFCSELGRICAEGASGRLTLHSRDQRRGEVVVLGGRVGWAVSAEQREDLGSFLWHLGKVSRDDLARVRRRFVELQGRRKFGTLLEEAGLVRRPVLRRCLLLHARAALAKLVEEASTTVVGVEPIRLDADEELTFELKELMRSEGQTETSATWADFRAWTDENIALTPLSEVPGYRASAVLTVDGRVVTAQSASAENDPSLIAIFLTTVLEHSTNTMTSAGVGAVNLVLLECEQGTVIARWIDPERRRLLAALLDPEGNLGMAKLRMQELVPKLAPLVHR